MHYTQRDRLKTIERIKKWMEENPALTREDLEVKAQHIFGCTEERARIYVQEALYK